jgi:hypothetical protein
LHDDELLAEFEALSDSESESERKVNGSESEGDADEIGDNYENDSPQDAVQRIKRRTASSSFQ